MKEERKQQVRQVFGLSKRKQAALKTIKKQTKRAYLALEISKSKSCCIL